MDKKTIIAIMLFFAVLVAGMFIFAYLKKAEIQEDQTVVEVEPEVEYASVSRIEAKHYFIDGVHTVAGETNMPTPCDLLEVDAQVAESMPEQITLNFNVINNAEMCAQVITAQRFMVSATASEDARFRALFMNREVELNLIPALPGEVPEDFEVFIKG
jgi:hypothetical protein